MKNGNIIKTLLSVQMAAALFCSCSIKEDRTMCPCTLNLDYSLIRSDDRIEDADNRVIYLNVPSQISSQERIGDFPQGQYMVIARRDALLSCYLGYSPERISSGRLLIPEGEDGDAFFSYHEDLFIGPDTEDVFVTPRLCNECTKIVVCFVDNDSASEEYSLMAKSSTDGLDLSTGRPTSGKFNCRMTSIDGKSFSFNMPRQGSHDIVIDVLSARDSGLLYDIKLYEELDRASYAWNAESLPPLVVINVERQNVIVDVKIIDWDEAVYFNYYM